MKEQQTNSIISKRLIVRRAKDLYVFEKDSLIKKAQESADDNLEVSTECYINQIKSYKESDFIYQACQDYARRYDLPLVKVLSVVKEQNK
jgi:hypothetical protein